MNKIAVFCGSSLGNDPIFEVHAKRLGKKLALENIGIVYGGANIGLMGAVANAALLKNGEVIGVLPRFLNSKEIAHEGLTQLILVDTMHERKTKMSDLSSGVIALPGGFGTLEELFEILTWGQLGLHKKPIGILNCNGFYDALITLLDTMVANGLLKQVNRQMVLVSDDVDELLFKMRNYKAPVIGKWINTNLAP